LYNVGEAGYNLQLQEESLSKSTGWILKQNHHLRTLDSEETKISQRKESGSKFTVYIK